MDTLPQKQEHDLHSEHDDDDDDSATTRSAASAEPRPVIVYTREQLLRLSFSSLVKPPLNMPELKAWFGTENENLLKKDDNTQSSNPRDRRFRRDGDDETTRGTFRSTPSQPSQMGNFKHQSLRTSDRDRDREHTNDRERDRDLRDKEGQERLRHLSDKYDRDRMASLSSSTKPKERNAVAATGLNNARNAQALASTAASRRAEAREAGKKKVGETSDDWRRVESTRLARDDRHDSTRKDREDKDAPRSKARDSSKSRRDSSTTRKDRDRDDAKEKRDRDEGRRNGEDGEDDPRRWRDDGKRDERLTARRTERQRNGADGWETTDRRWAQTDDRDGRYKRTTGRDRKGHGDESKEKDDRKDKEKEPAWMDTYIPSSSSGGILGGQSATGELDGIQAWKKGLKEKETQSKEVAQPATSTPPTPAEKTGGALASGLDEIQMFKLMMKKEEEKKRSDGGSDSHPNGQEEQHDLAPAKSAADLGSLNDKPPTPFSKPDFEGESRKSPASANDFNAPSQPSGSRLLAFAKSKPIAPPTLPGPPSGNGLGFEENFRPLPAVSTYDDQHHAHGFDDRQDIHSSPNPLHVSQPFNGISPDAGANPRGSRFAKFFDGKPREMAPGPGKAVAYTSPSPNPGHRPEHLAGPIDAPVEHRGIEDLFAMLQNSQRSSLVQHPPAGPPVLNGHHFAPQNPNVGYQPNPIPHPPNRMEHLYDSRAEDRFVPDGMVPGLRPMPTPSRRDTMVHPHMQNGLDEGHHFTQQRLVQQRGIEPVYPSNVPPMYNAQGRVGGLSVSALQQAQFRGGPSPGLNQSAPVQNGQRLPPGLANLGGRPPHDHNQFIGLPPPGAVPALNPLGNPVLAQQQGFNNYGGNVGFNGPHGRGAVQNPGAQHLDPRLAGQQRQLLGLGVNANFVPQNGPHMSMRPPHMLAPLVPPHLQAQGHLNSNQQSNELMAILMGGVPHRE